MAQDLKLADKLFTSQILHYGYFLQYFCNFGNEVLLHGEMVFYCVVIHDRTQKNKFKFFEMRENIL